MLEFGIVKNATAVRVFRLVCTLLFFAEIINAFMNPKMPPESNFLYLTIWGLLLTFFSFLVGNFVYPSKQATDPSQKHSLFLAWKWHMFLNNIALTTVIIVSSYYWLVLFPFFGVGGSLNFQDVIDHVLPFFMIVLDHSVMHVYPNYTRQLVVMTFFCMCYLIVNFIGTKVRGKPIYGGMDYKSAVGIMMPLGVVIYAILIFCLQICLTNCRLRRKGYKQIEAVKGKEDKVETVINENI